MSDKLVYCCYYFSEISCYWVLNVTFRRVWCSIQRGVQWPVAGLQRTANGGWQTSSYGNHLLSASLWSSRTLTVSQSYSALIAWFCLLGVSIFMVSCRTLAPFVQESVAIYAHSSLATYTSKSQCNSEMMFHLTPQTHFLIQWFPNYRLELCSMEVLWRLVHQFRVGFFETRRTDLSSLIVNTCRLFCW